MGAGVTGEAGEPGTMADMSTADTRAAMSRPRLNMASELRRREAAQVSAYCCRWVTLLGC